VKLSALFEPEPRQWGLRGDPYLWRAMRDHLSGTDIPSSAAGTAAVLHAAFADLTGIDLDSHQAASVYQEQYAHGGMSSGMISLRAWRQTLMPLLSERTDAVLRS
jgi:uncharacterized protein YycO